MLFVLHNQIQTTNYQQTQWMAECNSHSNFVYTNNLQQNANYLKPLSQETGKKILYPIDVGRPSGDYVAHIMLDDRAAILLKQTSKLGASPVRYLPVMAFTVAKTVERGELDRFAIKIAHRCWIPRAEHPKPELRSTTGLLLVPAEQCGHGSALREA
jgi:hypothetical protein